MNIGDILAKVAKGDALTDEEKTFAGSFNLQTQLDAAAGAARKKAEKERDDAKAAAAKLQADFDELKASSDPDKTKATKDAFEKRLARLEKERDEAKAAADKLTRDARVRSLAKDAGLIAAKGIDSKTFDTVVDAVMNGVDLDDADAVKAALDGFKAANAGMIAAQGVGGAGALGKPGAGGYAGANPFKKDSFNLTEQLNLEKNQPEVAAALKGAAQ